MTDKLGSKPKSAWLLLCTVIVALGVVAIAGTRAYNNHAEPSLVISGGSIKGVYFSVANALSDVSKQGSVSTALKAIPSPGSVENVRRLATREADFALLQNDTIGDTSTRGIARLYEETLHLIARKDSAISCMHDLEGKSVGTGSEGSGTSRLVNSLLDFSLGERVCERHSLSSTEAIRRLTTGEVDAAFFIAGLRGKMLLEAMESPQLQLVAITLTAESDVAPLESSQNLIDGFRTVYPYVSSSKIPMRTYGDQPVTAIPTLSVSAILACRSGLPDSIVRDVTAAIYAHKASLALSIPLLESVDENYGKRGMRFPLHAGASAYYLRREPGFLSEHAESMGFLLTTVVMGWSAIRTLGIFRKRSNKEHIDKFYERVLALTQKTNDCIAEKDWKELLADLNQVEREAFEELVNERLRPDTAYIILQHMISTCLAKIPISIRSSTN